MRKNMSNTWDIESAKCLPAPHMLVCMLPCGGQDSRGAGQWVMPGPPLARLGGCGEGGSGLSSGTCSPKNGVWVSLSDLGLWPAGDAGAPETSRFARISPQTKGLRLPWFLHVHLF